MENTEDMSVESAYFSSIFSISFHISSIFSISFHNFLLHFPNLFTIQPTFLPHFPYLFTIQLTFLLYFPNLFTIQPTFLPRKYGRKVSWIVKRYGKYWRNPSRIVIRFGKYRRKLWNDMKNEEEKYILYFLFNAW
jgi:hypothetical protein